MSIPMAGIKARIRPTWEVLKTAAIGYSEDNVSLIGAGVAFWAILSLSPLLVLLVIFTSVAYDTATTRTVMVQWLDDNLGGRAAEWTIGLLESASAPGATTLPGIASLVLMLWSASRMFHALQIALNHVWDIKTKRRGIGRTVLHLLRKRALTFLLVVVLELLVMLSLGIGTILPVLVRQVSELVGAWYLYRSVEIAASSIIICVAVGLVYMILPDLRIPWRFVWRGALLTTLLMIIGKLIMGWYLSRQSLGSYGAAGSVVVLLLWVYFSTQVFLFGAELTQAYARIIGWPKEPERGIPEHFRQKVLSTSERLNEPEPSLAPNHNQRQGERKGSQCP